MFCRCISCSKNCSGTSTMDARFSNSITAIIIIITIITICFLLLMTMTMNR